MLPPQFLGQVITLAQGLPPLPGDIWRHWNWQPPVLVGLGLLLGGYLGGVSRLWQRAGGGRVICRWQVVAFGLGLMALFVAFISPLNALSTALFSAHMGQHLLLIFVAAPLLVWGAPLIPWLWVLPQSLRRAVGRGWNRVPLLQVSWGGLTQPLMVWFLSTGLLWLWHTPRLYQAALERVLIHELEHLSFFGTAWLFWWLVLQPGGHRRLEYGTGVLFVFTTALQSGALGALLTFAPFPLYPIYASTAVAWHITPLEDQQLAGLMMWIPGSLIYVLTALNLFLTWLKVIEQKMTDQEQRPKPVFKPG